MKIDEYLKKSSWEVVHKLNIPERRAELFGYEDLKISRTAEEFLSKKFPGGIYRHQKEAIKRFLQHRNVCITTSTASGKTLVFHIAAIEQLVKDPSTKILAIYPLRALGTEQEERWRQALHDAKIDAAVGRIDGGVSVGARSSILRRSQILILTPDIIHAWLLNNLGDKSVLSSLRKVSLIVTDEIHTYTGVFGSNAAFLFRRVQHILNLLGASPQYICASATISEPENHLRKLFGFDFTIIGSDLDTSPHHKIQVRLVNPPTNTELLTEISKLLNHISSETESRFIAFVDSRKQTELITSIISRSQDKVEDEDEESTLKWDHLSKFNILPYRAGYEEHDRNIIQERLSKASLAGVVSTSALELGIDIPYLDLGVLIGVPPSSTNLLQRIGRIGRQSEGEILIINTGTVYDQAIFRRPEEVLARPPVEGSLYLGNQRIQYIHALCLARHGGEHDQVCSSENIGEEVEVSSSVNWPLGFLELCKAERVGEIPTDLQSMKAQSGENPNHTYPLRDVDTQFKVEYKRGPMQRYLGSLSYGQLMREAYPGAVYYYTTRPYRVYKVYVPSRIVRVRGEKKYTTKPTMLPVLVFPNLTTENVYASKKYGDLIVSECNLQIRESICGFKERRGPNEISHSYPPDSAKTSIYFNQNRFTKNYFTTGVVITHPVFNSQGVRCDDLANLLLEAFLMVIPFEKRDVGFASDRHRLKREEIDKGSKFVAIFDQTYGSLRLTNRLLEGEILQGTFEKAVELAKDNKELEITPETVSAFEVLCKCALSEPLDFSFGPGKRVPTEGGQFEKVIRPGSKGLSTMDDNAEIVVEGVFYDPSMPGLRYKVKYAAVARHSEDEITIPAKQVSEIPGESKVGYYVYSTGEVRNTLPSESS